MKSVLLLIGLCYISSGVSALYKQCADANIEDLEEKVFVSSCNKNYCRLTKGTKVDVQLKLKPTKEIISLKNRVHASIGGIPFPFIGIDGTSACENIYEADGTTKAPCPLKEGNEYIYKTVIDVLNIYPTLKTKVRWALVGSDGEEICFEVPARIVSAPH